ncbi:MAG: hypothetical protein ABR577_01685 [Pyrinomonadaceae bacterium]
MNSIWIDVRPEETSDSEEAKAKHSRVERLLESYKPEREWLNGLCRWKIDNTSLDDVKAHARGIRQALSQFLKENEFTVTVNPE